jgi:hypothetical protein
MTFQGRETTGIINAFFPIAGGISFSTASEPFAETFFKERTD